MTCQNITHIRTQHYTVQSTHLSPPFFCGTIGRLTNDGCRLTLLDLLLKRASRFGERVAAHEEDLGLGSWGERRKLKQPTNLHACIPRKRWRRWQSEEWRARLLDQGTLGNVFSISGRKEYVPLWTTDGKCDKSYLVSRRQGPVRIPITAAGTGLNRVHTRV